MDWSWQTHHQKLPVFYDHFGLIFKVVLHQEFCCIILPNWWEPSLILHLLTFQYLFPPDNWEYDAFLQQVLSQAPQHLRSSELVGCGAADEWCSTLWQEIAGLHKELTKLESSLVILPELFAYRSGIDVLLTYKCVFCFQHPITFAINFIQRSTKKSKKESEAAKEKEKQPVRSDEADSSRTLVSCNIYLRITLAHCKVHGTTTGEHLSSAMLFLAEFQCVTLSLGELNLITVCFTILLYGCETWTLLFWSSYSQSGSCQLHTCLSLW